MPVTLGRCPGSRAKIGPCEGRGGPGCGYQPYSYISISEEVRTDIEQVLREKKSFTLRCMLDGIKELQGRVVTWNKFASSVSIT
jgi:hypothetical protein